MSESSSTTLTLSVNSLSFSFWKVLQLIAVSVFKTTFAPNGSKILENIALKLCINSILVFICSSKFFTVFTSTVQSLFSCVEHFLNLLFRWSLCSLSVILSNWHNTDFWFLGICFEHCVNSLNAISTSFENRINKWSLCIMENSHLEQRSKSGHTRHLYRFPIIGMLSQPSHWTPWCMK